MVEPDMTEYQYIRIEDHFLQLEKCLRKDSRIGSKIANIQDYPPSVDRGMLVRLLSILSGYSISQVDDALSKTGEKLDDDFIRLLKRLRAQLTTVDLRDETPLVHQVLHVLYVFSYNQNPDIPSLVVEYSLRDREKVSLEYWHALYNDDHSLKSLEQQVSYLCVTPVNHL